MSRFASVLLALCAAHTAALVEVEDEDADLWPFVDKPFGRLFGRNDTKTAAGSCECLPWSSVYRYRGVNCGDGLEFITIPQAIQCTKNGGLAPKDVNCDIGYNSVQDYLDRGVQNTVLSATNAMKKEYCRNFFTRIHANDCIKEASNNDEEKWYGRSWCYVDASCPELNGGGALGGKSKGVSAKICSESAQPGVPKGDSILAKKSLAELHRWRKHSGLRSHMGPFLVKMSYKYWGEFFQKHGFLDFVLGRNGCPEGKHKECRLLQKIQEQECPGSAWVADSGDRNTKKFILCGKEVWSYANNTCLSGCEMAK